MTMMETMTTWVRMGMIVLRNTVEMIPRNNINIMPQHIHFISHHNGHNDDDDEGVRFVLFFYDYHVHTQIKKKEKILFGKNSDLYSLSL